MNFARLGSTFAYPLAYFAVRRRPVPADTTGGQSPRSLLTVDEAAEALRLSRSKIYEMIATGELPAYRLGGRIRIFASEIEALIEISRVRPSAGWGFVADRSAS